MLHSIKRRTQDLFIEKENNLWAQHTRRLRKPTSLMIKLSLIYRWVQDVVAHDCQYSREAVVGAMSGTGSSSRHWSQSA